MSSPTLRLVPFLGDGHNIVANFRLIPRSRLPSVDVRSLWASQDTKSHFWATYTREAAEHDGQILEKYNSDMDIVLIFVRRLNFQHHLDSH